MSHTWRHWHTTRLQPPFFSTGFPHLGQGLVLAAIQLRVSLSSWIFCFHLAHLRACAPMCHPQTILRAWQSKNALLLECTPCILRFCFSTAASIPAAASMLQPQCKELTSILLALPRSKLERH